MSVLFVDSHVDALCYSCEDGDGNNQWRGGRGGRGGTCPPSDNFLGALKSKGGAKIRNCQCEILYKIRKVQLFNKIKDSSNSGISR